MSRFVTSAVVHPPDASTLNVLRQALLADVPVLAMDTVRLDEYNGPLYVEQVSLHAGRVPLRGAAPCEFTVDVVNGTKALAWVTSADLKWASGAPAAVVHYRDDAEAAAAAEDTGFRIAALHPGQRIKGRFRARMGTGREHVRWRAVWAAFREQADRSFQLDVETTGALTAKEAVTAAAAAAAARLRTVANAVPV
jgi:DNA-directed RNA polymerase alpha subunit